MKMQVHSEDGKVERIAQHVWMETSGSFIGVPRRVGVEKVMVGNKKEALSSVSHEPKLQQHIES